MYWQAICDTVKQRIRISVHALRYIASFTYLVAVTRQPSEQMHPSFLNLKHFLKVARSTFICL